MPLTTETTPDCHGIVHHASGTVTGAELVEGSAAALRLVQNTQNFHYEFVDLSGAEALEDAGEEHLQKITEQDHLAAIYRPKAVVALVAPLEACFELGKEWERRVRPLGWSTLVTRDREEALSWLAQNYPPPPKTIIASEIKAAEPITTPVRSTAIPR